MRVNGKLICPYCKAELTEEEYEEHVQKCERLLGSAAEAVRDRIEG